MPLALATALAALAAPASAQTDDTAPFYAGGSLGVTRVSNVYRQATDAKDDSVTSVGLLAGLDQRYGRQHVTLDGSLQQNRYSTNQDLNYRSHSLRAALNWQTVGDLSGVLSAKSDQSLADFNLGAGVNPVLKKNIETNDEYQATARLGLATRYILEAGWNHRSRNFSAEEYDRFVYRQDTGSLGLYATPAGNVKLGLAVRHTKGQNPRYPVGVALQPDPLDPTKPQLVVVSQPNDYSRNDVDFTTRWAVGGHSTVNTRISRSRTKNSLDDILRDFSGTTGSVGWNWDVSRKLQLSLQYSRDTGQESVVRSADLNRVYTSWQLTSNYEVTGKISLNANASSRKGRRTSSTGAVVPDAIDNTDSYGLGLRWAFSRSLILSCQYDHVNRDNSVPQYVFNASSYGCNGQAILY
ncbi:hypothetical protein [Pelomonas cellulosilytica]|uniref:Beta-barrel porin 2 n=1 Tax=Pelomonas cellulosilytica TaxID=2906762 RepID=A0ABS8XZY0_9BURK|nr:hypothetical protein [Pelomonas sp. P8]MCE4554970.1 hypothetical protein [Pelomonas sp. P8]